MNNCWCKNLTWSKVPFTCHLCGETQTFDEIKKEKEVKNREIDDGEYKALWSGYSAKVFINNSDYILRPTIDGVRGINIAIVVVIKNNEVILVRS